MKKKTLAIIFSFEAILLAVLVVLTKQFPNLFSSVMVFPFEQIAVGFAFASEAGWLGKGMAVALWFGISAIPAILALCYQRNKETRWERLSLFVLSGVTFLALYGMMNPQVFRPDISGNFYEYTKLIKSVFGISIWSVVVLYVTLRLIRLLRNGNKEQLLKYLRTILYVLSLLFTAVAATSLTNGIMTLIEASSTGIDKAFGALRLIAELIPYLFDIAVIMRVLDLLKTAEKENQDSITAAASRVSSICYAMLGITTTITAVSNIIQIVFMRWLTNVSVTVDIPIISIVFIVLILLFARLLIENKRLRDDNSLFI